MVDIERGPAVLPERETVLIKIDFVCNKHIKDLFNHIGYSLSFETTCRKTLLQSGADEIQQIRNAVHDIKFLWLLMKALSLAYNI